MRISNRTDPVTTTTATVLTLVLRILSLIITFVSVISGAGASFIPSLLKSNLMNIAVLVFLTLALVRKRKDPLAAVFFLLSALPAAAALITHIQNLANPYSSKVLVIAWILCILVDISFYVLLAVECFGPGKISGTGSRSLLILLPIASILLSAGASYGLSIADAVSWGDFAMIFTILISVTVNVVMQCWMIFVGIAFSIPVYDPPAYGWGPVNNWDSATQKSYNP